MTKLETAKMLFQRGGISLLLRHTVGKYLLRNNTLIPSLAYILGKDIFKVQDYFRIPIIAQDEKEFYELLKLLKNQNVKKVLEIGTYKGGTAYLFYKCLGADVVTIDISPSFIISLVLRIISKGKIKVIKGNSHLDTTFSKVIPYSKFDCLFIDGDHSFYGVREDYHVYKILVEKGGVIAFHDIYSEKGVLELWINIRRQHISEEIVNYERENKLGIGVIYKRW